MAMMSKYTDELDPPARLNESDCPGAAPFAERLECIRPPATPSSPPPPLPPDDDLEKSSNHQLLRMLIPAVHEVRVMTGLTHDAVINLGESQRALESRVGLLERDHGAMRVGIVAIVLAIIALLKQVLP